MSNKIFALLLICCLTYSAYTACHADCGGDTDGTHCVTGESGADKCMTCDSGSILVIATTADLFGTCKTGIAAACPDNKFAYYETNPASPLPFCGTAS